MTAKFAGKCSNCDTPIAAGSRMIWDEEEKSAYCGDPCELGAAGEDPEEGKTKKVKKVKEPELLRIVVCGSRKWKNKKAIKTSLKRFNFKEVDCVILGGAPGVEQMALPICRELKMRVVLTPPNATRDATNASFYRNEWVFSTLKPNKLLAFHEAIDNSSSTAHYVKLARNKGIDWDLVKK